MAQGVHRWSPPEAGAKDRVEAVALEVDEGNDPLVGGGTRHVWTAPSMQGLLVWRARGRVRSCVRPPCAVRMTAGPDEIRGPAPNQRIAFHDALTQTGCAGPRDRPVLPSLRFAPTPPSAAAPPMGKLSPPSYAAASVAAVGRGSKSAISR